VLTEVIKASKVKRSALRKAATLGGGYSLLGGELRGTIAHERGMVVWQGV